MKKCILCNQDATKRMRIPTFGEKVITFLDYICPECEKTVLMIRKAYNSK